MLRRETLLSIVAVTALSACRGDGATSASADTDGSSTGAADAGPGETGVADGTGGEESGGESSGGGDTPDFVPPPPAMRRLLAYQYRNAVGDLLGPASAEVVAAPEDFEISGQIAVGAAQIFSGNLAISQYEDSALLAVSAVFDEQGRIYDVLGCTPVSADDSACAEQYVREFGRRAFRRPLTDEEVGIWLELHAYGRAELESFEGGAFLVLAGMLQSPNFLYMVEVGQPDPDDPGLSRLTGYELATKMSFLLAGTTPDDVWLDVAEQGGLDTRAGIRDVAWAMLERPGARDALDEYFIELYDLRGLDSVVKVPSAFPNLGSDIDQPVSLSPDFAPSARGETLELLRDIIWEQDGDFRDVLTAEYTFVNPLMEFFYFGSAFDPEADMSVFTRVELPAEQGRAGILGHVGLLSLLARSNRTAPTLRGQFIRSTVLCDTIPPPPDDVEFELPDDDEAPTMREKLIEHQNNPACASCHIPLDNLGFALENYDGFGFYRTTENGFPVDASAELIDLGEFDGLREMAALLRESPKVPACAVKKLYRHAQGHVETEGEETALEDLTDDFVDADHSMQELLVELVSSKAFRTVGVEE